MAAAAAPLLLAGCQGVGALGPLPSPAPDVVMLHHAIGAEELMVARYAAAVGALAGQTRAAAAVAVLLTEHQEHLDQLRSRLILPPRLATARPSPSPSPPPTPTGGHQVLAELVAAERAASNRLQQELLGAPPALAQLLASIGASEAAHVVVLAQSRPT